MDEQSVARLKLRADLRREQVRSLLKEKEELKRLIEQANQQTAGKETDLADLQRRYDERVRELRADIFQGNESTKFAERSRGRWQIAFAAALLAALAFLALWLFSPAGRSASPADIGDVQAGVDLIHRETRQINRTLTLESMKNSDLQRDLERERGAGARQREELELLESQLTAKSKELGELRAQLLLLTAELDELRRRIQPASRSDACSPPGVPEIVLRGEVEQAISNRKRSR